MANPAQVSTGIQVTFDSGFLSWIKSLDGPEETRNDVNTTVLNQSGTHHTYIPAALIEGGTLDMTIIHDETKIPPITKAAETVTVTYPNGATIAFTGYMNKYRKTAPLDDLITADVSIKVASAPAYTGASSA